MNRLKKVTRSDMKLLSKHYLAYEPYSDFNAVSMWGYMVPGARFLRNGDAVLYEMTDYNSAKVYLSIFGGKDSVKLIETYSEKEGLADIYLENVPETTLEHLKQCPGYQDCEEDIDNHDYIFSVEDIASMSSPELHKKKKVITKLVARHPNISVGIIDHSDPKVRRQIYALFRRWIRDAQADDWEKEFRALKRELKVTEFRIVTVGAFINNRLVGFTVNEVEENGYYQGHFGKALYKYPGLGLFLEVETAKILQRTYRSLYINLQQDMGIEGIRYYKSSLGPIRQLKKYRVHIQCVKH